MLDVFWGELFVSPVPLQLSLNRCSHACHYCFANLNRADRQGDVGSVLRLLQDYQNRRTPVALLLQQGYPVVVSNLTDPFASTNHRQMLAIFESMAGLGIPVALQTKGGQGIAEALGILPPSVWYVSLECQADEVRQRIAPGAPPLSERWVLIEQIRKAGHRVVLGVNPVVPEWLPKPEELVSQAVQSGVEGIWAELLHLNDKQQKGLSTAALESLGTVVIQRSAKKLPTPIEQEVLSIIEGECDRHSLPYYQGGHARRSDYWKPFREIYPKTFPVMQDFINALWDQGNPTITVLHEDFAGFITRRMPVTPYNMGGYLGRWVQGMSRELFFPSNISLSQLLHFAWNEPRVKLSPLKCAACAYYGEWDSEGFVHYLDEHDQPIVQFSREGFPEWFTPSKEDGDYG